MPVRSLSSSILKWPDADTVREAAKAWALRQAQRPGVVRIGMFGSYARGDAGVGSDLDLIVVVRESAVPFPERSSAGWGVLALPVPVELLVYTEDEWRRLQETGGRFPRMLADEAVWMYPA